MGLYIQHIIMVQISVHAIVSLGFAISEVRSKKDGIEVERKRKKFVHVIVSLGYVTVAVTNNINKTNSI